MSVWLIFRSPFWLDRGINCLITLITSSISSSLYQLYSVDLLHEPCTDLKITGKFFEGKKRESMYQLIWPRFKEISMSSTVQWRNVSEYYFWLHTARAYSHRIVHLEHLGCADAIDSSSPIVLCIFRWISQSWCCANKGLYCISVPTTRYCNPMLSPSLIWSPRPIALDHQQERFEHEYFYVTCRDLWKSIKANNSYKSKVKWVEIVLMTNQQWGLNTCTHELRQLRQLLHSRSGRGASVHLCELWSSIRPMPMYKWKHETDKGTWAMDRKCLRDYSSNCVQCVRLSFHFWMTLRKIDTFASPPIRGSIVRRSHRMQRSTWHKPTHFDWWSEWFAQWPQPEFSSCPYLQVKRNDVIH